METLFAIDIDGTIAGGPNNHKLYIQHHIEDLELDIAQDVLDGVSNYQSFLKLPQVRAYRRDNEERFLASRASCRVSPKVINALEVVPHAVEGVNLLARLGTIRYYTKRSSLQTVKDATTAWLAFHQFPCPKNVVICAETSHKLDIIHQQETASSIMLIDDRFIELLAGFKLLKQEHPQAANDLKQRLTLVAFGANCVPEETSGLRTLAFPSWENVQELVASLGLRAGSTHAL